MDEETKNAQYYFDKAVNETSNGEYEQAIASFTEAIRLNPQSAEAFYNRGNAKRKLGHHEDAIKDYDEAIRLEPRNIYAYNNRGNTKYHLGRNEDAIKDFNEAVRLDPQEAQTFYNRGVTKYYLGQHEDAIKDYDEAIRLNPQIVSAYSNRGAAKQVLGQHEDAIKDYDEAIRLDPQSASAYYNRGLIKNKLWQHEDAITDYDEAIRLDPQDAMAYYNKGLSHQLLGMLNEAVENFKTFVKLADESFDEYIEIAKSQIRDIEVAKKTGGPVKQVDMLPPLVAERLTETIRRAVMFLDICDSTETLYIHGDQHYVNIFLKLKRAFYDELDKHNSLFRKNLGDGFMATFKDSADAVRTAMNIIKLVKENNNITKDDEKINIRVGMEYGQVELDRGDKDDCYGINVVAAQRIEGLIKDDFEYWKNDEKFPEKDRIFVSDRIYNRLNKVDGFNLKKMGLAKLKGFGNDPRTIYMVDC